MGLRTTQRILDCAICGRTPGDGEYLWEMCGEYWCADCIDKDRSEAYHSAQTRGIATSADCADKPWGSR